MASQHDLFLEPELRPDSWEPPEHHACAPLAVPCAWRNRSNQPCRRLARHPVRMAGEPMFDREGRPMLLCDMACFNGPGAGDTDPAGDASFDPPDNPLNLRPEPRP